MNRLTSGSKPNCECSRCTAECIDQWDGLCWVRLAIDRLAAYEDSGLTPDEIAALRAEVDRLCAALKLAQTRAADIETEVEAGRLVRLPCAPGDTVYDLWYSPCHHGETHPDSSGCCGCEDECDMRRVVRPVRFRSVGQILSEWSSFQSGWYYMTEEAARAALEGE